VVFAPTAPLPPSWPPGIQVTATGVPWALRAVAVASASASGNNVSVSPCISNVGACNRPTTDAIESACSSARVLGVAVPAFWDAAYASQTAGMNPAQVLAVAVEGAEVPSTEPKLKNSDAQPLLNTPGTSVATVPPPAAAAFGLKARPRSFQVMTGTVASIRGSYAAAIKLIPPP